MTAKVIYAETRFLLGKRRAEPSNVRPLSPQDERRVIADALFMGFPGFPIGTGEGDDAPKGAA